MDSLHNALLEMVMVAGMNEHTGLVPSQPQPPILFHHEQKIFSTAFETQTLAAISGHVATFPTESEPKDSNYPPAATQLGRSGRKSKGSNDTPAPGPYKTWAASKPKQRATLHKKQPGGEGSFLQRNKLRTSSFRVFDLASQRASTANLMISPAALPLGADTLNSLMTFCFPDGAYVKDCPLPPSVHYLVLTDIDGYRSYAVCVTAYQSYSCFQTQTQDVEKWELSKSSPRRGSQDNGQLLTVYVPECYVAVSKSPYMTVLKDALSRLVSRIQKTPEHWCHLLKEFTLHLTKVPLPPPGPVAMHVSLLYDLDIVLLPPDHPGKHAVDIPLYLPFLHLHPDQILLIFAAILSQQRIVVVSAHHALTVLTCESLLTLIQPFHWNFTYVPLLSWNLIELIEAPGTFIMGCNARDRQYIERVEELVLVDLDLGEVKVCPSLNLPRIPPAAAHIFIMAIKQARRQTDWLNVGQCTASSQAEAILQEQKSRSRINRGLQTVCLELMANLFRDVFSHTNREKRFFHKDQFLETIEGQQKEFYMTVLGTDIFGDFLKQQLSSKFQGDYWSDFLEKTKPYSRNSLIQSAIENKFQSLTLEIDIKKNMPMAVAHSCVVLQALMPRKSNSLPSSRSSSPLTRRSHSISNLSAQCCGELWESAEPIPLKLPPFVYMLSHSYIDNSLLEVENALKSCETVEARSVYAYLRGILLAAKHQKKEALEAFHDVETCNARIFPLQYVSQIMSSLSTEDRTAVEQSFMYQKSALFREASSQQKEPSRQPVIMELSKIPEEDIDESGFAELVQLLFDVTTDSETISRLFDALTLGERTVVDPYTFEEFYQSWKENEVALQQVNIPSVRLDPSEILLKVSDICRCSVGTGRIVLSMKRLFFLHEGSQKWKEIIQLRNIKKIDVTQQRTLLKPVLALKVYSIDEKVKPFSAILKDCCQEWFLLINEMWAGKLLAEELRNPSLIHSAAQNVLLVNAFIQSGQSDFANHRGYEMEEAESLCYFMQRRIQGATTLPPDTKEFLQQQLDPSQAEVERTAVEALLYVPGRRSGVHTEDFGPRLWCALSSGRVAVYDAACWAVESLRSLSTERLVCLVAVGDRQVWVGCMDSNIYVMDQRTKLCNQTLPDHRDMVTEFCHGDDDSIYSASIDGQIIRWDTNTLNIINKIHLPGNPLLRSVQYKSEQLWCCGKEELLLLSTTGNVLNKVVVESGPLGNPAQIDCFLLSPNNQLWLGLGRQGEIHVYDADTLQPIIVVTVPTRGLSRMVLFMNQVWVGSKDGEIFVFDASSLEQTLKLSAHSDAIRALSAVYDRYVVSGAGSLDGRVSVWRGAR